MECYSEETKNGFRHCRGEGVSNTLHEMLALRSVRSVIASESGRTGGHGVVQRGDKERLQALPP
jgi:hypothetical protein